jgi:hypothetical protein
MMTMDKDGSKRQNGEDVKELKELKKNGRGSGSDNNESISYLGDDDDVECSFDGQRKC